MNKLEVTPLIASLVHFLIMPLCQIINKHILNNEAYAKEHSILVSHFPNSKIYIKWQKCLQMLYLKVKSNK